MYTRRRLRIALSALVAVACADATAPYADLTLVTEAAPAAVSIGDTLTLRAIITNSTDKTIRPGTECGPPALFEVSNASGVVLYPIPPDGVFTCELNDYHQLDPAETDTIEVKVLVDLPVGDWAVRSGFRKGATLDRMTAPVAFKVQ